MTTMNHLTLTNRKSIAVLLASILALALVGFTGPVAASPSGPQAPQATCPGGQCFEDVPASSLFYDYVNNLYKDGIISGYTCGSTPSEPCVAPDNRPYYRPAATVSRAQMSKFVDLGRRNIADAIGHSLYISTTAGIAIDAETRSGGEAVYAECLQSGNNCYALEGYAPTGDYAGYMYGGKGVYVESDDAGKPGLDGRAYGSNSYAVRAESAVYRGAYAKSDSTVIYSMYVDTQGGPTQGTAGLNVRGTIRGEGDLVIGGSKAGYVVDIMQNLDGVALEAGDVVTIVGSSEPVLGEIPVVTVKKAASAYDTGVTGVVDKVWYAPDAATKTAYEKQEADMRAAMHQQGQVTKASRGTGSKPVDVPMPAMTITDEQGTLHALPNETQASPGGYVSVVTLGAYRAIKVDASYGAIKAGDLLTTSPHAGYAMKADPAQAGAGTVIGKALGSLDSGTGTLPVMVSLR